ncbi:hypothetical protein ACPCIX_05780 [Streptomyces pseudogriseolus]|uniref:Transmembrane transport protein n=1 Tax=Streptomyces gancidicus BKS 13-15 TaxID=1284664 RepID=M3BVC9_STREZ|nr:MULTISPECIES: hypothetical protein [Streptomyces]EMF27929.1 transmembrane transport protein [Streptomyces gancidicus BKS 13-15]
MDGDTLFTIGGLARRTGLTVKTIRFCVTYQPAGHFWALQWAETGLYLGRTLLLAGFCAWWIRRRVT